MLHFPKRHVIWRFQQTIRGFISQKVHCLRVPHAICDKNKPCLKTKTKTKTAPLVFFTSDTHFEILKFGDIDIVPYKACS